MASALNRRNHVEKAGVSSDRMSMMVSAGDLLLSKVMDGGDQDDETAPFCPGVDELPIDLLTRPSSNSFLSSSTIIRELFASRFWSFA